MMRINKNLTDFWAVACQEIQSIGSEIAIFALSSVCCSYILYFLNPPCPSQQKAP
jgi:hypothetical protein